MNPKLQAIGLLKTWLNECNIEYSVSDERLTITRKDGGSFLADFVPKNVMSTDLDVCMEEFHKLTQEAGYDMPSPLIRGKAAKKRIFDDNLLARWRHSEMRTVPNQTAEALRAFEDVARREARIFIGRNKWLVREMGYDIDVAFSDAMIWTNTFLGRYNLNSIEETRKLLTNYLRQRFAEMHAGMMRERRNVIPDPSYSQFIQEVGEDEVPTAEWKAAHDLIKVKSPQKRKDRARELLEQGFGQMGHDNMVEVLTEKAASHPCVDTRKAASKYLKEHIKTCASCQLKAKEEVAGNE